MRRIAILALFMPLFLINAQNNFKIKALKIDEPIKIDGKLEESSWSQAEKVELNYEIQITDNKPAHQKTIAMVLYDNQNLYFGFICYDTNPSQIRARITDRDKIWEDDFIILIIDTYGEQSKCI